MSANPKPQGTVLDDKAADYVLDDQIGFLLRMASQRHTSIFSQLIAHDLTPTRFAALAKLYERGPMSQNELGRQTAMDVATIKGVVDRLRALNLIETTPDPTDGRRHTVGLTARGRRVAEDAIPTAKIITEETLSPLSRKDREMLLQLIRKLC